MTTDIEMIYTLSHRCG